MATQKELVYAALNGRALRSVRQLEKETGLTERQVRGAIGALRAKGVNIVNQAQSQRFSLRPGRYKPTR